ncbi:ROK family transcriptional regulator [Actinoallomurus rhizosphaericola]|uniref:ROK family transcriptional regulator n=1 Tax=Actinoallomurus rhizosphaericola TaxID=2952536 RepID=UPI002090FD46|nr:ROK family transcriptional regulator [Actinoallomurus rhizosphaericola]MCO5992019.1 ROK family transcriptional regulator [Actinoallomurus rhizosphaericola]
MAVPSGGETANTTSVLRIMNERAVYERIRLLGPVSRPQLAEATGLSKPTISLALADLERAELVRPVGHRTGNAGRAALLYEIRPEAGWVIGLDVGRQWVRAALADLGGEIAVREDVPADSGDAGALIDQLGEIVDNLAAAAGGQITHIVLGTPGVYDPDNERLHLAPNIPGWNEPGVTAKLAERLPAPFAIENDIALAALGEQGYGLGADLRHFVYVSIGTGIGMGIIVDGRLYRGARGAAGEIAFLPMGETDPLAHAADSRRHGMLESVASAPAVVATARRMGMTGEITAKRVFDEARDGEPAAVRAVAREADHVAHALAGVIALLDPELIVLGGGIGGHGADVFLGEVRDRLETMTPLGAPRVEVSPLGDEAVVLGTLATGLATARALVFDRAITGAADLPGTVTNRP